ncbi:MAG: hypothetical protein F6K30_28305 [Cyanothece sp. SIO2G6]|nr:hypothetical protein [Cyanothece sp. SIO2G6]
MNRKLKLILDIAMGTVIPIFVLNNLNEQLGTTVTYVIAALIPVAWVLTDLLLITRRFNFITSYIGAAALMRGLLSFWFVDGIQFAFKDSVGAIFTVVVFGISVIIHKPVMYYFLMQGMGPDSPDREQSLKRLLAEPKVHRSLVHGTILVLVVHLWTGIANFSLNLRIVVASFGTALFNQQVAQANAITRIVLAIPELMGVAIAAVLIRRAMLGYLPQDDDDDQSESDFWDLLKRREIQQQS